MKKNSNWKLYLGVFLIVIQIISLFGSGFSELPKNIPGLIGYFIFGIIGIALLFQCYIKR